jgi:hypothetical protein
MDYPTITPSLLNEICNELLDFHDSVHVSSNAIRLLVPLIDHDEKNWHIQGNYLWRVKAWKTQQEQIRARKEEDEAYKVALDSRKSALTNLTEAICAQLGVDNKIAFPLALKIIQKGGTKAAAVFGIDITELPTLPNKHIVIGERGERYEL